MKSNKKTKKLEFTKETIARLGEQQLSGFQGGTAGNNSVEYANQCTLTLTTVGENYSCNAKLCKPTR